MKSASIYFRTEPKTKAEAQKIAKELGVSLSALLNAFLIQFINTKGMILSAKGMSQKQRTEIIRIARKEDKSGKQQKLI